VHDPGQQPEQEPAAEGLAREVVGVAAPAAERDPQRDERDKGDRAVAVLRKRQRQERAGEEG
jgi:hypothetical protein